MNAADRAYRDAFLAKGLNVGSRCFVKPWGDGTIKGIGGNMCLVNFDDDESSGDRIILFESIAPPRPTCIGCDRAFTDDETVGTPWTTVKVSDDSGAIVERGVCFQCYTDAYWSGTPASWRMVCPI